MSSSLKFKIKYVLLNKLKNLVYIILAVYLSYLTMDIIGDKLFLLSGTILYSYIFIIIASLANGKYSEKELILLDFKRISDSNYECSFLDEHLAYIIKFNYKSKQVLAMKKDYYYRVVISDKNNIVAILSDTDKMIPNDLVYRKNEVITTYQKIEEMEKIEKLSAPPKRTSLSGILSAFPTVFCIFISIYYVILVIINGDLLNSQFWEFLIIAGLYLLVLKRRTKK